MTIEEAKNITNNAGIYAFHNLVNGKYYIGQAIRLRKRLLHHLSNFNNDRYDAPLYKAFRKYGLDNFEYLILEELEGDNYSELSSKMDKLEKEYIIKYNSYGATGYNQTNGGDAGVLGYKFTEEQSKHTSEVRFQQEAKKLDMLFVYIVDGPSECKYITAGNITALNIILKYKGWKQIPNNYLRNAKRYICIYNKYILASSSEELTEKIKKYFDSNRPNGQFHNLDKNILIQYKNIVDALPSKTIQSIMKATGLNRHTVYNRNLQIYGTRTLERMRNKKE